MRNGVGNGASGTNSWKDSVWTVHGAWCMDGACVVSVLSSFSSSWFRIRYITSISHHTNEITMHLRLIHAYLIHQIGDRFQDTRQLRVLVDEEQRVWNISISQVNDTEPHPAPRHFALHACQNLRHFVCDTRASLHAVEPLASIEQLIAPCAVCVRSVDGPNYGPSNVRFSRTVSRSVSQTISQSVSLTYTCTVREKVLISQAP